MAEAVNLIFIVYQSVHNILKNRGVGTLGSGQNKCERFGFGRGKERSIYTRCLARGRELR